METPVNSKQTDIYAFRLSEWIRIIKMQRMRQKKHWPARECTGWESGSHLPSASPKK